MTKPLCPTCGKRNYERGQTYTPGDECVCGTLEQRLQGDFRDRITPDKYTEMNVEGHWILRTDKLHQEINNIVSNTISETIADYQINYEQKHIAEAVKLARQEGLDPTISSDKK